MTTTPPPNSADEFLKKGILEAQNNQPEEAIRFFQEAVLINPDWSEPHGHLAWQYFLQKDFQSASQEYGILVQLQPDNAEALYRLGDSQLQLSLYRQAFDSYLHALHISPQSLEIQTRVKESAKNFFIEFLHGTTLNLDSISNISPAHNPISAYLHYSLGRIALLLHKRNVAIYSFLRARKYYQMNSEFFLALSQCYLLLNQADKQLDWNSVESCLKHALYVNPDFITAREKLGDVYTRTYQLDLALQQYTWIKDRDFKIHLKLGNLFIRKQQYSKAREHFETAIHLNPAFIPAYINLGLVFEKLHQPDNAEKTYSQILTFDPQNIIANTLLQSIQPANHSLLIPKSNVPFFYSCYPSELKKKLALINSLHYFQHIKFKLLPKTKSICPSCGNNKFIFQYYRPLPKNSVVECEKCHLLFTLQTSSIFHLNERYQDEYWSPARLQQRKLIFEKALQYRTWIDPWQIQFFEQTSLPEIESRLGNDKTLLDIGSGDGTLMMDFQKRGWKTIGLEISKPAVEFAKSWNLLVYQQSHHEMNFLPESVDLVTMSHVIEHIVEPIVVLKEIHRIIKPGGYLLIRTPCWDNCTTEISGKYWLNDPEHLLFLSRKTINAILQSAGFKEINFISYVGIDGETYPEIWNALGFNELLKEKLSNINQGDVMVLLAQKIN